MWKPQYESIAFTPWWVAGSPHGLVPRRGSSAQMSVSNEPLLPNLYKVDSANTELLSKLEGLQTVMQSRVDYLQSFDMTHGPLAFARSHMVLEGVLLDHVPGLNYQEVQQVLNNIGRPPHPLMSRCDQMDLLVQELQAYRVDPQSSHGGFQGIWARHCDRLADLLGVYHSLYLEVLASNIEFSEQRSHVETSHKLYREYASTILTELTEALPLQIENFFQERIDECGKSKISTALSDRDRHLAVERAEQWAVARNAFQVFCRETSEGSTENSSELRKATAKCRLLQTALGNIVRQDVIDVLKAEHKGVLTAARVVASAAPPQGIASYIHFGYIQLLANDAVPGNHTSAANIASVSGALGVGHKLVSDGLRPFVQLLMDKTIGLGLKKVNPLEVYPNVLRVVTEQGSVFRRSDEQMDLLDAQQKLLRDDFVRVQNTASLGTPGGDMTFFTSFGGFHALRDMLGQLGLLNAESIHLRAACSMAAGATAAGTSALWKHLSTHGEEDIPTHAVIREQRGWSELAQGAAAQARRNLAPTKRAALNAYANNVCGLAPGMLINHWLAQVQHAIAEQGKSRAPILHVGITHLLSGALLHSFFANNQVPAEAKALGNEKPATRWTVATHNIVNPNRASLPHTHAPKTAGRRIENAYQVTRGLAQFAPQAIISGANLFADSVGDIARKERPDGSPESAIELGRGRFGSDHPGQPETNNRRRDDI